MSLSARYDWCSVHNVEHTGFSTLYCPKCEREKEDEPKFVSVSKEAFADAARHLAKIQNFNLNYGMLRGLSCSATGGHPYSVCGTILSVWTGFTHHKISLDLTKNRFGTLGEGFVHVGHHETRFTADDLVGKLFYFSPKTAPFRNIPLAFALSSGDPWEIM